MNLRWPLAVVLACAAAMPVATAAPTRNPDDATAASSGRGPTPASTRGEAPSAKARIGVEPSRTARPADAARSRGTKTPGRAAPAGATSSTRMHAGGGAAPHAPPRPGAARDGARGSTSVAQGKSALRAAVPGYAGRADVLAFVDDLVGREGVARDRATRLFADARYSETAVRLMSPAATTAVRRDWTAYRARFVEPVRIAAGVAFWDDNAATLAKAERDFGVPAEIVVGIVGVETVYGRNTGGFRVLDVLTTLAFDFPAGGRDRSPFFRAQLVDALRMDRDGAMDLATQRGSYAGAVGLPQFMPGSIRDFAVDYDGDGRIDLVGSAADVIGSVANFLARHGWQRGLETHLELEHPAPVDAAQAARIDAMVGAGSVPTLEFADLAAVGFVAFAMPPMGTLALIDLPVAPGAAPDGRAVIHVAGTQNFHALTRYNRSYFYAMSVIELGATIRTLRDARR